MTTHITADDIRRNNIRIIKECYAADQRERDKGADFTALCHRRHAARMSRNTAEVFRLNAMLADLAALARDGGGEA